MAIALIAAPWLAPAAQAHNPPVRHLHIGHVHIGHVHVSPAHAVPAEASAPEAAERGAVHELRVASSELPADPIDTGSCAIGCCGPGVSCCGSALLMAAPGDTPPVLRKLMLGFEQPAAGAGVEPEALRKPPRTFV